MKEAVLTAILNLVIGYVVDQIFADNKYEWFKLAKKCILAFTLGILLCWL